MHHRWACPVDLAGPSRLCTWSTLDPAGASAHRGCTPSSHKGYSQQHKLYVIFSQSQNIYFSRATSCLASGTAMCNSQSSLLPGQQNLSSHYKRENEIVVPRFWLSYMVLRMSQLSTCKHTPFHRQHPHCCLSTQGILNTHLQCFDLNVAINLRHSSIYSSVF